jgi:hypothetical protein
MTGNPLGLDLGANVIILKKVLLKKFENNWRF